ncbi:MAG: hypothetical protein WKG07_33230 [Hymenobacter sp.]
MEQTSRFSSGGPAGQRRYPRPAAPCGPGQPSPAAGLTFTGFKRVFPVTQNRQLGDLGRRGQAQAPALRWLTVGTDGAGPPLLPSSVPSLIIRRGASPRRATR